MYRVDSFCDLGSLSVAQLKGLIKELDEEEIEISYKRRVLHEKIDVIRGELVNRRPEASDGGDDVGDSGSSGVREPRRPNPQPGAGGVSLPAPESSQ
jgi:hypothetical protein